jgi:hypothetical protein
MNTALSDARQKCQIGKGEKGSAACHIVPRVPSCQSGKPKELKPHPLLGNSQNTEYKYMIAASTLRATSMNGRSRSSIQKTFAIEGSCEYEGIRGFANLAPRYEAHKNSSIYSNGCLARRPFTKTPIKGNRRHTALQ